MKGSAITTGILLCFIANAFAMPQEARSPRELLVDNPTSHEDGNKAMLPRGIKSDNPTLVKKAELVCEIVHVVITVGCHYWPTHASTWNGMSNWVVTSFAGSTFQNYDCFLYGETVGGINAWDYANDYDCFVPGYYTDSHCTHQALGACSF